MGKELTAMLERTAKAVLFIIKFSKYPFRYSVLSLKKFTIDEKAVR